MKLLIKKGATIDILDNDNTTPLLRAVEKNKMKIAELLLKNGANVDAKDKHGITALMRAGEHGMFWEFLVKDSQFFSIKWKKPKIQC